MGIIGGLILLLVGLYLFNTYRAAQQLERFVRDYAPPIPIGLYRRAVAYGDNEQRLMLKKDPYHIYDHIKIYGVAIGLIGLGLAGYSAPDLPWYGVLIALVALWVLAVYGSGWIFTYELHVGLRPSVESGWRWTFKGWLITRIMFWRREDGPTTSA